MKKILCIVIFLVTIATYSQEKKEEGKNYNGWFFICNSKKSGDEHYYQAFKKNYV